MNNVDRVRFAINRAKVILEEAHSLSTKKIWNLVIRRAQETVELALKGALQWAGLEVPKIHDVGALLRQHSDRFPEDFRASIPKMASISRILRAERELSFYGDEESGLPPEMLYDASDAEDALTKARFVIEICEKLLKNPKDNKQQE